jgi:hypothetical protein
VVPVLMALRSAAREAAALRRELGEFVALGEPILELRAEATAVARRLPELQQRARPSATSAP